MNTAKLMKKGVTLIELLIVVLILAALSAIAIPRISQSATNAKINACRANIDIINSAIEQYFIGTGAYPGDPEDVTENTTYFPGGAPICPIINEPYDWGLINNRIDATGHVH